MREDVLDPPPARPDGDGRERQGDRQARAATGARSSASSRATGAQTATGRTARAGAPGRASCAARGSRAPPPSRPRRGSPCHGMVPGADRRADGARRIGAPGQRGVDLPPRLQPGRATGRASAAVGATQAEARPATAQGPPRARHPQPHADPPAPDKGPSSQSVRPWEGDLTLLKANASAVHGD